MTPILGSQAMRAARLDHALKCVVVQSWDELMPDSTPGLIHIEYETAGDGTLDFLKIWASTTRGYWDLVCEFWMRPLWSHAAGMQFGNDFHPAGFAQALELVMDHESEFSKLPDRRGLIPIYLPTQAERKEAERFAEVSFGLRDSAPREAHVAA